MESGRGGNQIPDMQQHGYCADGISSDPKEARAGSKRNVQQNCREKAQYGKAPGNDHVSDGIVSRRGGHSDERANIPEKGETRRDAWQQASPRRGPPPIQKEKVQKNAEGNRARAVTDRVDQ